MNEAPAEKPARKSRLPIILGIFLLGLILLGIAWWWYNRPIQPVVLTPQEKQVVEQKIEAIHQPVTSEAPEPAEEPEYEKGTREIILTERELNGLLNHNTGLGQTVSFQLATGAVHARIETDLDPDLPIVGGRKLKARARFLVSDTAGKPSLVLDDLTVWGVSLPNDWLGGLKGQDLLEKTVGGPIAGVEEFKIERGRLVIRLKE
ncbi:MAG TPA: hypothetical protein VLO11_12150 [Luteolibacter sp.]|nr:hypothetical protein [Luteolibacter sp.]